MLHMEFSFFNPESTHVFKSTFLDICSTTSYSFGFPYRSKRPPIDILKFLVNPLSNHNKKVAFVRVDEYGVLARSSEFMKTCHNMNIIVQTTGEDSYFFNGKSEIPNNNLANITRALLLNSIQKKELWCVFPISMTYGYPDKLIIGCVVMFLTSSVMFQYLHTNTSKYGV